MKGMKHMSKNRVGSGAGCAAVVGFLFSLLVLTVAGCKKADLPPEQVAVDVMTRCVMGMYEGLDSRLTGDIKNFVSKDQTKGDFFFSLNKKKRSFPGDSDGRESAGSAGDPIGSLGGEIP